jgi:hypothetical protein
VDNSALVLPEDDRLVDALVSWKWLYSMIMQVWCVLRTIARLLGVVVGEQTAMVAWWLAGRKVIRKWTRRFGERNQLIFC